MKTTYHYYLYLFPQKTEKIDKPGKLVTSSAENDDSFKPERNEENKLKTALNHLSSV